MRFSRAHIAAIRPRRISFRALAAVALAATALMAAPVASAASAPTTAPAPPAGLIFAPHVGGAPAVLLHHPGVTSSKVTYNVQSGNWAGYAAVGGVGSYTEVASTWTEPGANCGATPNSYASFWTGFDGYNSGSVEQTGTLVYCYGTTAYQYAWVEFYPASPVYYNVPIYAGDRMTAKVTSTTSGAFTLVLSDATRGWTATSTATNSGLARSSAEVIAEAPSSSGGILPLADFGSVTFTSSTVNNGCLSGTGIDMVGPGYYKAITGGISGCGNFPVTWKHS